MSLPFGYKFTPEARAAVARGHQALSSLTWDDIRDIRARKPGTSLAQLAREYGVHYRTIHKIIRNESWVDPEYVPGDRKTCALRECRRRFTTNTHNKRFCCGEHRSRHHSVLYWAAERERRRRVNTANRLAIKSPWSLDRPVSSDSATTFGELVTGRWEDPAEVVVRNELRDALGDIDEQDVEAMSDDDLEALRDRLRAAGYGERQAA